MFLCWTLLYAASDVKHFKLKAEKWTMENILIAVGTSFLNTYSELAAECDVKSFKLGTFDKIRNVQRL